jgi:2'-5' RNA ligase
MRLFVAVFPSPEAQRAAASVIDALRRPGDGVSWVKPDNLHYTLRFIGEVGDDGARRVGEAARAAANGRPAFDAVPGGIGAFPNPRQARVLWLGLAEGAAPLVELAGALEDELAKRGFDRERRRFSAHLTLGRVRDPRADWTAAIAAAPTSPPERFRVDRMCAVVSHLSPKGSVYTIREEVRLEG